MKLKKDFLGIAFYQSKWMRNRVVNDLMEQAKKFPVWDENDLQIRKHSLSLVTENVNHKLYYISKKVQDHAEFIKFEKINLAWFRQVKGKSSTFILNKNEFFRFYVDEGKTIYVLHFRREQHLTKELLELENLINPLPPGEADFRGCFYDTFVIRFDPENHPEGYMPENEILGQDFRHKMRFVKLLLFVELSDILVVEVKDHRKVNLDKTWDKTFEGKVKNESGTDVILVDTTWNRTTIRTEGFKVGWHIRIQPWGPGRSLYKPIIIEEFMKSGYVRQAKRLKEE